MVYNDRLICEVIVSCLCLVIFDQDLMLYRGRLNIYLDNSLLPLFLLLLFATVDISSFKNKLCFLSGVFLFDVQSGLIV